MNKSLEILKKSYPNPDCPICNFENHITNLSKDREYTCQHCGKFKMSSELVINEHSNDKFLRILLNKHLLRGHILNENLNDKTIFIKEIEDLEKIIDNYFRLTDIEYKLRFILNQFKSKTSYVGQFIEFNLRENGQYFCHNSDELLFIINELVNNGFIYKRQQSGGYIEVSITLKGISECQKTNFESKQCFLAMWFNTSTEILKPTIEKVFKSSSLKAYNYSVVRIDDKHHSNDITDEIFFEIKKSKFLIVDLTCYENEMRGGVYFEAGYAMGLGIPVILTCEKNHFKNHSVHFDVSHRPIIFWEKENMEQFEKDLINKIGAIIV